MAVGRIDHALVRKQHLHRVNKITTGVIGVKGYPRAAFYRILFASAALEMPEDISTYIFCSIATVFGESLVFCDSFSCAAVTLNRSHNPSNVVFLLIHRFERRLSPYAILCSIFQHLTFGVVVFDRYTALFCLSDLAGHTL